MGMPFTLRTAERLARRTRGKVTIALALMAIGSGLGGCAQTMEMTGSVPETYQDRHPILLTRAPEVIYVPVSARGGSLADGDREMIASFVKRYREDGEGPIHILAPSGSANEAAASYAAGSIRAMLADYGLGGHEIVISSYQIVDPAYSAPVKLAYETLKAVTGECGYWPKDLSGDFQNRTYWNHGCATQQNFAAQLTQPRDLIAPRGETPRDGQRRTTVFEKYRNGEQTAAETGDSQNGTISDVGN